MKNLSGRVFHIPTAIGFGVLVAFDVERHVVGGIAGGGNGFIDQTQLVVDHEAEVYPLDVAHGAVFLFLGANTTGGDVKDAQSVDLYFVAYH